MNAFIHSIYQQIRVMFHNHIQQNFVQFQVCMLTKVTMHFSWIHHYSSESAYQNPAIQMISDRSMLFPIKWILIIFSNRLFRSLALHCQSEERQFSIGALLTMSLIILLVFFVCFAAFIPPLKEYSVLSSLKRIFSLNHQHSTYQCLNGIRALSLFWIIFGHVYIFQLTIIDNPIRVFDNLRNSWLNQLIMGAVYGVDTFFFISGFLSVSVFIHTFNDQSKASRQKRNRVWK